LRTFLIVGVARIMLSTLAFAVLLLAAAVNQAILTLFGRRHAVKYCVANRWDAGVADPNRAGIPDPHGRQGARQTPDAVSERVAA
jgi:hypothetical protein